SPANHRCDKVSWTQPDVNKAIRQFKSDRASSFYELVNEIERATGHKKKQLQKKARKIWGRNALARHLNVKSPAMISNSPDYMESALALGIAGTPKTGTWKRSGFQIAEESKSVEAGDQTAMEVENREAIEYAKENLKPEQAEPIIEQLARGQMTADRAI